MLRKLQQETNRWRFSTFNRLTPRRVRKYLVNYLLTVRWQVASPYVRASIGFLRWMMARALHGENRISFRSGCFITGRGRGSSRRFTLARTRIKHLSGEGRFLGLRKSSW